MKLCPQCSSQATAESGLCTSCGYEFDGLERALSNPSPEESELRYRFTIYLIPWLLALLAFVPKILLIVVFWTFPAGLFAPFFEGNNSVGIRYFYFWIAGGWAVYVVHAWAFFRAKRRALVNILFVILCLLALGNIAGCYHVLSQL